MKYVQQVKGAYVLRRSRPRNTKEICLGKFRALKIQDAFLEVHNNFRDVCLILGMCLGNIMHDIMPSDYPSSCKCYLCIA